ncbi:hypothetical protein RI367_005406 [Sorochytrium milnesiophthora]
MQPRSIVVTFEFGSNGVIFDGYVLRNGNRHPLSSIEGETVQEQAVLHAVRALQLQYGLQKQQQQQPDMDVDKMPASAIMTTAGVVSTMPKDAMTMDAPLPPGAASANNSNANPAARLMSGKGGVFMTSLRGSRTSSVSLNDPDMTQNRVAMKASKALSKQQQQPSAPLAPPSGQQQQQQQQLSSVMDQDQDMQPPTAIPVKRAMQQGSRQAQQQEMAPMPKKRGGLDAEMRSVETIDIESDEEDFQEEINHPRRQRQGAMMHPRVNPSVAMQNGARAKKSHSSNGSGGPRDDMDEPRQQQDNGAYYDGFAHASRRGPMIGQEEEEEEDEEEEDEMMMMAPAAEHGGRGPPAANRRRGSESSGGQLPPPQGRNDRAHMQPPPPARSGPGSRQSDGMPGRHPATYGNAGAPYQPPHTPRNAGGGNNNNNNNNTNGGFQQNHGKPGPMRGGNNYMNGGGGSNGRSHSFTPAPHGPPTFGFGDAAGPRMRHSSFHGNDSHNMQDNGFKRPIPPQQQHHHHHHHHHPQRPHPGGFQGGGGGNGYLPRKGGSNQGGHGGGGQGRQRMYNGDNVSY